MAESHKICTGPCGRELPATTEHFSPNKDGRLGLYAQCKDCRNAKLRGYRLTHPNQSGKEYHRKNKLEVITKYGGKCSCCGEGRIEFLTIDHVNNDGAKHRAEIGKGSDQTYRWLIHNGFPDGFQVLCYNCNIAKSVYGACPHQKGQK